MKIKTYFMLVLVLCSSHFLLVNATESDSARLTRTPSGIKNQTIRYPQVAKTGSLVTMNYILRTGSTRGPVIETTIESIARANGLYREGATYAPFELIVGYNQVIVGFDKGIMGMKQGQRKTIKVTPDEGYGRPTELPIENIAPEFTITRSRELFKDILRATIPKSDFPEELKTKVINAKIGDEIIYNGYVAKVVDVSTITLTVEMENTTNPFYKKNLVVGTSGEADDMRYTIIAVNTDTVTMSVVNKKSPFYGKKFAVGEKAVSESGSKLTIKKISDTTVSVLSDHFLMDKVLYFDVRVVKIQ